MHNILVQSISKAILKPNTDIIEIKVLSVNLESIPFELNI